MQDWKVHFTLLYCTRNGIMALISRLQCFLWLLYCKKRKKALCDVNSLISSCNLTNHRQPSRSYISVRTASHVDHLKTRSTTEIGLYGIAYVSAAVHCCHSLCTADAESGMAAWHESNPRSCRDEADIANVGRLCVVDPALSPCCCCGCCC